MIRLVAQKWKFAVKKQDILDLEFDIN